jgi:DNA-binding MarR family transcriptional regulator/GNAT superfamily N-acetyltransferase
MSASGLERRVDEVRRFNRFYTQHIGVLQARFLDSPLSLTQGRVLYEIAHRDRPTATEVGDVLGLDAGYLSRILREFQRRGFVTTERARRDGRQRLLHLSATGRRMVATLDTRARRQIATLIGPRSAADQATLIESMDTIRRLLSPPSDATPAASAATPAVAGYTLRTHRVGDMGWIVHRHGALYAQEYGWDERFEGFVAGIVAHFIEHFDPVGERCWIAERDGAIVGSVFVVRHTKTVAKLRLLYVEPSARGLGIGRRLVDECISFARAAGYRTLMLWTNSILDAARHIYEGSGFTRVGRERQHRFGHDNVFETWKLELRPGRPTAGRQTTKQTTGRTAGSEPDGV